MARQWDDRYADSDVEQVNLGPDEHDMDLLDGSWEDEYYSGRRRSRDWQNIGLAIAILIVLAMLLPGILVLTQ